MYRQTGIGPDDLISFLISDCSGEYSVTMCLALNRLLQMLRRLAPCHHNQDGSGNDHRHRQQHTHSQPAPQKSKLRVRLAEEFAYNTCNSIDGDETAED